MAIKKLKKGFTLLVAVIFASVFLSVALTLGSIAYKQTLLASSSSESQVAFYSADTALECALYADQQQGLFDFYNYDPNNDPPSLTCGGTAYTTNSICYDNTGNAASGCPHQWVVTTRIALNNNNQCADISFYKGSSGATYIFAQGYSVPCTVVNTPGQARLVARGLRAQY